MTRIANQNIREKAKATKVHLWQIAEQLGCNDGNFSRKLRRELPQEEQERILDIIDRLSNQKCEVNANA